MDNADNMMDSCGQDLDGSSRRDHILQIQHRQQSPSASALPSSGDPPPQPSSPTSLEAPAPQRISRGNAPREIDDEPQVVPSVLQAENHRPAVSSRNQPIRTPVRNSDHKDDFVVPTYTSPKVHSKVEGRKEKVSPGTPQASTSNAYEGAGCDMWQNNVAYEHRLNSHGSQSDVHERQSRASSAQPLSMNNDISKDATLHFMALQNVSTGTPQASTSNADEGAGCDTWQNNVAYKQRLNSYGFQSDAYKQSNVYEWQSGASSAQPLSVNNDNAKAEDATLLHFMALQNASNLLRLQGANLVGCYGERLLPGCSTMPPTMPPGLNPYDYFYPSGLLFLTNSGTLSNASGREETRSHDHSRNSPQQREGTPISPRNDLQRCSSNTATSSGDLKDETDDSWTSSQNEEGYDDSSESMLDSLGFEMIKPKRIVSVLGQEEFWKLRKSFIRHQQIFSAQLFELHRVINVQLLLSRSSPLLVETTLELPPTMSGKCPLQKVEDQECIAESKSRNGSSTAISGASQEFDNNTYSRYYSKRWSFHG